MESAGVTTFVPQRRLTGLSRDEQPGLAPDQGFDRRTLSVYGRSTGPARCHSDRQFSQGRAWKVELGFEAFKGQGEIESAA